MFSTVATFHELPSVESMRTVIADRIARDGLVVVSEGPGWALFRFHDRMRSLRDCPDNLYFSFNAPSNKQFGVGDLSMSCDQRSIETMEIILSEFGGFICNVDNSNEWRSIEKGKIVTRRPISLFDRLHDGLSVMLSAA